MDAWGSHLHVLAAAALRTTGPILELGCGEYSTPLLHALSGLRRVVSAEAALDWKSKFDRYHVPGRHDVVHVANWDAFSMAGPWGMAFVDHSPGERRRQDILRLAGEAEIVIAHDTEASCYGWGDVWARFGWAWTYTRYDTWTTLAGNGPEPEWVARVLVDVVRGPTVPYR